MQYHTNLLKCYNTQNMPSMPGKISDIGHCFKTTQFLQFFAVL